MTAGKTRAGFDIDLRIFQQVEASLAMTLMSRGTYTVEVKADQGCAGRWTRPATGNLFVEYKQPSGRSGIATTTADTWAFEYDDNCWLLVPTQKLRTWCRIAYKQGRHTPGGDDNKYHGVLLPIRWMVPPYLCEVTP